MSALFKKTARNRLNEKISDYYRQLRSRPIASSTFNALLKIVWERTSLLRPKAILYRWSDIEDFLRGLLNISLYQKEFLRPLHKWNPREEGDRRTFYSLLDYLFNIYPTPPCLRDIWLKPRRKQYVRYQGWYLHLAKGKSLRNLDVPLRLTKRMVHYFYEAPHHYSVEEALRHAQVLALGGDKELADAIIASRLGREQDNEDFWESVIHFFINAKELELQQVIPIVDFLHSMKFEYGQYYHADGSVTLPPPHPGLSMKGRSYGSLKKQVEAWHGQLRKRRGSKMTWQRSKLREFQFVEELRNGDDELVECHWIIKELLSSRELVAEGRYFHHCVATYSRNCYKGWTTIWSMRRRVEDKEKRIMTIEVDVNGRFIRQARAKCNRTPIKKGMNILHMWARKEGLAIGKHH